MGFGICRQLDVRNSYSQRKDGTDKVGLEIKFTKLGLNLADLKKILGVFARAAPREMQNRPTPEAILRLRAKEMPIKRQDDDFITTMARF